MQKNYQLFLKKNGHNDVPRLIDQGTSYRLELLIDPLS